MLKYNDVIEDRKDIFYQIHGFPDIVGCREDLVSRIFALRLNLKRCMLSGKT